jgi:hypothetical protein
LLGFFERYAGPGSRISLQNIRLGRIALPATAEFAYSQTPQSLGTCSMPVMNMHGKQKQAHRFLAPYIGSQVRQDMRALRNPGIASPDKWYGSALTTLQTCKFSAK